MVKAGKNRSIAGRIYAKVANDKKFIRAVFSSFIDLML